MIDIHCHILPGLDDGPGTLEESLKMAEEAVFEGIDTIVATPHDRVDNAVNHRQRIFAAIDELNEALREENIPLQVLPGQEAFVSSELLSERDFLDLLPVNVNTSYIYLELPENPLPSYVKQLVREMQAAGFHPVIANPEKNAYVAQHPDFLYDLVKNGCLVQVAAASVNGDLGGKVRKFTQQLIGANLVHFIGSNNHRSGKGFGLMKAYQEVAKQFGNEMAYMLMQNNWKMVEGAVVVRDEPVKINRRGMKRIF
ncbi:protein-tyrosine phosphatase [Terribacillus saccharophilus]|uniref:Tyrosine-protein phosphatase n=1 Tax=Terribacillus saccharophilus TaxID=361277 RepID=A0AAX2EFT5_9BACI|nr:protein-tyrosine phosphatase [Terribacillus saccharophilus]